MRMFLVLLFIVLSARHAPAQTTANSSEEATVKRIIESGGYWGIDDKQLGRMGDAAAVAVTKVIGTKNITAQDIEMVLIVLHLSFSAPRLVEKVSDRAPRTTLFVLQSLDALTTDQRLKQRIVEERTFVQ